MSQAEPFEEPRRILERHRAIWSAKPVLRAIYHRWYIRTIAQLPVEASRVVEIGGGGGNLKAALPGIISSDIVYCNWLDLVFDAQQMPIANESLDGLMMVDVLHHLTDPLAFCAEARRVLRPGGRLVILDVFISPFSHLVMKLFHPEPVDMAADLFAEPVAVGKRHPWCANQGVATLLFWRHLNQFQALYEDLAVVRKEISDVLAYPLSGGFEFRSLYPRWGLSFMYCLDWLCTPLIRYLAFRSLIVLEKKP